MRRQQLIETGRWRSKLCLDKLTRSANLFPQIVILVNTNCVRLAWLLSARFLFFFGLLFYFVSFQNRPATESCQQDPSGTVQQ